MRKQHNWKKKIGGCLLVFSCIPLIWGGIRIGKALSVKADSEGQYAYNEFQYSDMYGSILGGGYQQGVPVKSMAEALERVQTNIVTAQKQENPPSPEMTLSVDLTYYEEPDTGSAIAAEIPKGTRILYFLDRETCIPEYGYGACSFPGYESGWRCVRPFLKAEETDSEEGEEAADKLPYAYIRLEQLEAVAWEYRRQEPAWSAGSSLPAEGQIFGELRAVDKEFYRKGIYASPDLSYPVWDIWDTVLLGVFIAFVLAGSILLLLSRNEWAQDEKRKMNGAS